MMSSDREGGQGGPGGGAGRDRAWTRGSQRLFARSSGRRDPHCAWRKWRNTARYCGPCGLGYNLFSYMRRVLVVDDEENLRLLVRTILRREGFEVEVAS